MRLARGGSWAAPSDMRLKANIEPANLDLCTFVVRSMGLKRFEWASLPAGGQDRKMVGWIAQEVQAHLPKAVVSCEMHGLPDALAVDSDQIVKMMYGALQDAWNKLDTQKEQLDTQKEQLNAQSETLSAQSETLAAQSETLAAQKEKLDSQATHIETLEARLAALEARVAALEN